VEVTNCQDAYVLSQHATGFEVVPPFERQEARFSEVAMFGHKTLDLVISATGPFAVQASEHNTFQLLTNASTTFTLAYENSDEAGDFVSIHISLTTLIDLGASSASRVTVENVLHIVTGNNPVVNTQAVDATSLILTSGPWNHSSNAAEQDPHYLSESQLSRTVTVFASNTDHLEMTFNGSLVLYLGRDLITCCTPITFPTTAPTKLPTLAPSMSPTKLPTDEPTPRPTKEPTLRPTKEPTPDPTKRPTKEPTPRPTKEPTPDPTKRPTKEPTPRPTKEPTPDHTKRPTKEPTPRPTKEPTPDPTKRPTKEPTPRPTKEPTPDPTKRPTKEPTPDPTKRPTKEPTPRPTKEPTPDPTKRPTKEPTPRPTKEPTPDPTKRPTKEPTAEPTESPTEGCVWKCVFEEEHPGKGHGKGRKQTFGSLDIWSRG
jgi:hypothetical protein